MALTGLDIYKKLPKTNCGDCGVPTCLAFAMRLAGGQAELDACPHVSEEAKAELSEASAPPIRVVTIGKNENSLKIGGELVMFRHEKTFYNPPGFALLLEDTMDEAEVGEKLEQVKKSQFERVAQLLKSDLVAIKASSGDAGRFAELAQRVKESIDLPLVLMSRDPNVIRAGLEIGAEGKPLIYAADEENYEEMVNLAKEHDCPLAVLGANDLGGLAQLVDKITDLGMKDLVLDPGSRKLKDTLRNLIFIRRAALKKKLRSLGFPVITFPCEEADEEFMEAAIAGIYVMKYAGIIVLSGLEAWKALPLYVLRQNIYTDPQKPLQVDEGIYPIGDPDESSPVLITTNFSLTYFTVSGEVEASTVPSWLCVMDVEGLSVLTAWAAGKFVPDKIAPFIKRCGISEKVKHHKLVIPGYLAQISGELEEELPDWQINVGPREAGDIPAFLKRWSA